MLRKEEIRFLKTSDLSELKATLKIEEDIVDRFQKATLEYLEKLKSDKPIYQPESRNRFIIGKRKKDLISLIDWGEKSLNVNNSHGTINAKIRGDYLKIEVEGEYEFVDYFYKLVRGS